MARAAPHRAHHEAQGAGGLGLTLAVVLAVSLTAGSPSARAQSTPDLRSFAVIMREGDSLFRAGRHSDALSRYEAILRRDSSFARAVFQVAVLRSWANEFDVALRLYAKYVDMVPDDVNGHVAYARVHGWAGQFDAAIARYDSALAREPDYRDAVLGRAQIFAWWGRHGDADSSYATWIAKHPADSAAMLERARAWAMAGRYGEALAVFRRMAGSSREAAKAVARVLAWQGDLVGGEAMWVTLTRDDPSDAEAWVELARVRRWLDRPRAARDALDNALRVRPGYAEALEQRQWVDAELQPSAAVTISQASDSDENESWMVTVAGGFAMPVGRRLTVSASARRASLGALDGSANSVRGAWGLQSASGRLGAALELGLTQLHSDGSALTGTDETFVSGSARATAQIGERGSLGVGVQRSPFDEVATSIRSGVALDYADIDATVRLPLRLRVATTAGRGAVIRGVDGSNARWGAGVALQWTFARSAVVSVATRAFGYDRTAADGYFSPRRYQISQVGAEWHSQHERGWQLGADAALGRQRLRLRDGFSPTERAAWTVSGSAGYRWRPGVEWFSSAMFANVAAPGALAGDADYRYTALSLGIRRQF